MMSLNQWTASFAANEISPRPAPLKKSQGIVSWLRVNFFNSWFNAVLTLALLYLSYLVIPRLLAWAFIDAVWLAGEMQTPAQVVASCREAKGACWAFIAEKRHVIFFGLYPYGEEWRPVLATAILIGLAVVSTFRSLWGRMLIISWIVAVPGSVSIMYGALPLGFADVPIPGLSRVETRAWGGLPLTVGLSMIGLATAFPLSILLALGRRSKMPFIRTVCATYIELFRGVPLITVLFMASVIFPLFLPEGWNFDYLLRAQAALTLFTAAYLAEVVRGGLQSIPKGQYEAADSIGLGYWQKHRFIILPQALAVSIPALVNTFIGCLMDTTLVIMVGLFDLLGSTRLGLADAIWSPFYKEAYLFVSLLFFVLCFSMSKYSQLLEADLISGKKNR
jgi:general L-amino acid transport system permease protein